MTNIFTHQVNDTTLLFYLTDSYFPYMTIIDLIHQDNPCIISWAETVITDNIMIIKWLTTHNKYRHRGMADLLLKNVIKYANDNNIDKIELDDMSDRFLGNHNVYINNKFVYLMLGEPEMCLKLG